MEEVFAQLEKGVRCMKTAYDYAKECVGIVEWAEGSNPQIEKMFAEVGHPGQRDDLAWCAAFVGAMLHRAGLKGTGTLAARDYLKWGREIPISEAREGDVFILPRGTGWQGHTGFIVKMNGNTFIGLSGNAKNRVGEDVYTTSKLLGVRRAGVFKPVAAESNMQKPHTAPQPATASPVADQPVASTPVADNPAPDPVIKPHVSPPKVPSATGHVPSASQSAPVTGFWDWIFRLLRGK